MAAPRSVPNLKFLGFSASNRTQTPTFPTFSLFFVGGKIILEKWLKTLPITLPIVDPKRRLKAYGERSPVRFSNLKRFFNDQRLPQKRLLLDSKRGLKKLFYRLG